MSSRVPYSAMRHLALSGRQQTRGLHMTGPATFSSLLTSERPALNLPRDVPGLRAECQKRKLPTAGSKAELIDRLSAHEISSRSFTTDSTPKRPIPSPANPGKPIRHFNTSRSLKAVRDTSTIDFAYIPDFDPDQGAAPIVRVPILPHTEPSVESKQHTAADGDESVMLPQILTVSADGTHIHAPSAMSEVSDNTAIDFQGMAAKVASTLKKPAEQAEGMARQIWGGLVDDVLGPSQKGGAKPT